MEVHAMARQKLVQQMRGKGVDAGLILLQGGDDMNQYDTDTEFVFR